MQKYECNTKLFPTLRYSDWTMAAATGQINRYEVSWGRPDGDLLRHLRHFVVVGRSRGGAASRRTVASIPGTSQ
jgi:hypothetical protein